MKIKLKENNIQKIAFGILSTRKKHKKILFCDYDGTLLYSYTKDEFLNLSVLPDLPDRTSENLTCDGWNWTLSEITSHLNDVDDAVNVGANYHTTDNKTHITCKPTETFPQAYICLTPTIANDVTINWGDGTTDTWASASQETKSHAYTGVTDSSVYDITISCSNGIYGFATYITGTEANNKNCIYTDIRLSNKVTSSNSQCFYSCISLQSITIPSGITNLNGGFSDCYSLQYITIPSGITNLNSGFSDCYSLQYISIPDTVSVFGNNCFLFCRSLDFITIPSGVTNLGSSSFNNCNSMQFITFPDTITLLDNGAFNQCVSLQSITVPNSVTDIGTNCFSQCVSLQKLYMKPTVPPTLANSGAIPDNANLVIYVPRGTLSAYQSASNWSTYSSKMVEYDY